MESSPKKQIVMHGTAVCRRCGTCCAKGGPALHHQDLSLVRRGIVGKEDLFTLRPKEPVHDQVLNRVVLLDAECIKIRSVENGTACHFFHIFPEAPPGRATAQATERPTGLCAIHSAKPAECMALNCRDTTQLASVSAQPRISRLDLLTRDSALEELIRIHDERCAVAGLLHWLRSGCDESSEKIHQAVAFDRALRSVLLEQTQATPELLPFLLGRPLPDVIRGLRRWLALEQRMPSARSF